REALEQMGKRVAIVTPDRALAARVVHHLARWNIAADDTAGRPLSLTPAGRLFLLLADLLSHGLSPVTLVAALGHPLVRQEGGRAEWLSSLRAFERALRGPAPSPGLDPLRAVAVVAKQSDWWAEVEPILERLRPSSEHIELVEAIDCLVEAAQLLAGDHSWAREDGQGLSSFVDELRLHAGSVGTKLEPRELHSVLRDAMDEFAVRPPYGGHPRVAIYGLLESRGARADLVLCGGLNEGSWPQSPSPDTLLAPAILRRLGVPATEFRIGLAAHDLAGAMGAPEVVLSRSIRDAEGPTIPSRFLLRAEALLGELTSKHRDEDVIPLLSALDRAPPRAEPYARPRPSPTPDQRKVKISATALDRLLGDPYQFYAREILGLKRLEPLAADPFGDPALRGTLVHEILDQWHRSASDNERADLVSFAEDYLRQKQVHPLFWGLWRPRITAALQRFEQWIGEAVEEGRTIAATEVWGEMTFAGVKVQGIADRIDRLADGTLAVVDYKTGNAPSAAQVEAGYALQLGVLGLIAREGQFSSNETELSGAVSSFEYWSLARAKSGDDFGYVDRPIKEGRRRSGLLPEEFLPRHEERLTFAIEQYILGDAPFTAKENPDYPGYSDYDQLMRLEEWIGDPDQDKPA
ncbi:MAG: PD-(D/E)XK nuclease family protein, partial [Pseudomonadota bacterium]